MDGLTGSPVFHSFSNFGGLRVVHACWNARAIEEVRKLGRLERSVLERHSRPGTPGYESHQPDSQRSGSLPAVRLRAQNSGRNNAPRVSGEVVA